MPIHAKCIYCKQSVQAPDTMAGTRFRCPKCTKFFPLPTAAMLAVTATHAQARTPLARTAYGLGAAALVCGSLAFLVTPFAGAVGYARSLAWLGLLTGGGAMAMAYLRDECDHRLPLGGFVASVLALTLVVLWTGAAPIPGGWVPRESRRAREGRNNEPGAEDKNEPGAARKGRGQGKGRGKGKAAEPPAAAPPLN